MLSDYWQGLAVQKKAPADHLLGSPCTSCFSRLKRVEPQYLCQFVSQLCPILNVQGLIMQIVAEDLFQSALLKQERPVHSANTCSFPLLCNTAGLFQLANQAGQPLAPHPIPSIFQTLQFTFW